MNNQQFDQTFLNKSFKRAAIFVALFTIVGWGMVLTPFSDFPIISTVITIVKRSTVDLVLLFALLIALYKAQKTMFLSNAGAKAEDIEQELLERDDS